MRLTSLIESSHALHKTFNDVRIGAACALSTWKTACEVPSATSDAEVSKLFALDTGHLMSMVVVLVSKLPFFGTKALHSFATIEKNAGGSLANARLQEAFTGGCPS